MMSIPDTYSAPPANEAEVAELLQNALRDLSEADPEEITILSSPGGFDEAAEQLAGARVDDLHDFLTMDKGVHLRLRDGSEYVISVSCYRRATR